MITKDITTKNKKINSYYDKKIAKKNKEISKITLLSIETNQS